MGLMVGVRLGVAAATVCGCGLAARAAAATYTVRPIAANTSALAINDRGDVTGCLTVDLHGAYVLRGGSFVDLTRLIGADSCGVGLNTAGDLVGSHMAGDFEPFAFLLPHGTTDVQDIAGRLSRPGDVNDAGQVVGGGLHFGLFRAFLWAGGHTRDLGTLGGRDSQANASAARGQAAGWAQTSSGATHAFIWRTGHMRDLGTLGGSFSEALDVNASDHAVGRAQLSGNGMRAFLWTPAGGMRNLGRLVPRRASVANAINQRDVVVGSARVSNVESRAFVWTAATGMRDLNELIPAGCGWFLGEATDVNAAGQIVGNGVLNGVRTAFLLTPT